MKEKNNSRLSLIMIIAFGMAVVLLLSGGFLVYRSILEKEYDDLIGEALVADAESRKNELEFTINSAVGQLQAISYVLNASDGAIRANNPWVTRYLANCNSLHPEMLSDYLTLGSLRVDMGVAVGVGAEGADTEVEDCISRLVAGETVTTSIRFSPRLNGYYFSVLIPVLEKHTVPIEADPAADGSDTSPAADVTPLPKTLPETLGGSPLPVDPSISEPDTDPVPTETEVAVTVGVLRCRINASLLVTAYKESAFYKVGSCMVLDSSGHILYAADRNYLPHLGADFLQTLPCGELPVAREAAFLRALANGKSAVLRTDDGNEKAYLTGVGVSFNGWSVINYLRYGDVSLHSSTVMLMTAALALYIALIIGVTFLLVILSRRRSYRRLLLEKNRYNVLAGFSDVLLFEYSGNRDVMELSDNARRSLPLETLRLEGLRRSGYIWRLVAPEDRETVQALLSEETKPGDSSEIELRLLHSDGTYHWYRCQYKATEAPEGRRSTLIGKLTDIEAQRERERELAQRAQTDTLTSVMNRCGEQLIRQAVQHGEPGVLLMLDIDGFKAFNDRLGHDVGDAALRFAGQAIKDCFRGNDLLCRVGGDEFLLYLRGDLGEETVNRKLRILDARMAEFKACTCTPAPAPTDKPLLRASAGYAFFPREATQYEELFRLADARMYDDKKRHKQDRR